MRVYRCLSEFHRTTLDLFEINDTVRCHISPPTMSSIEDSEKAEEVKLKSLRRLHILMHPGFIISAPSEKDRHYLFGEYLSQARKLEEDEVMLVFLFSSKKGVKEAITKGPHPDIALTLAELETAGNIQEILGKRAFIFTRDSGLPPNLKIEEIAKIIEARGYCFDKSIETFAYGESLGTCVSKWAQDLNMKLKLTYKTKVLTRLTNGAGNKELAQWIDGIRGNFKRLEYITD